MTKEKIYVCRDVPEMEIKAIEFGLLSPELMNRIASVEVVRGDTSERAIPASGTLMDPRMGPASPGQRCMVCGKTLEEGCLGHFGIIKLPEPVINPLLENAVIDTVNSVDPSTGKIIPFPKAKVLLKVRKLRELQLKLRELEESFYKGKMSLEEFSKRYKELHAEISAVEDEIIEAVRKARERYIEKARDYFERRKKAPAKFLREIKKQREEYINTLTPMIYCPKCDRKFYRLGHTTKKGKKIVCPFCGHEFSLAGGRYIVGVRSPYSEELIDIYEFTVSKDDKEPLQHRIVLHVVIGKSRSSKKTQIKRLEQTVRKEEEPEGIEIRRIKKILERIPDDDALVLGRHPKNSRPERAILEALIVPPNQVRPTMILQQGQHAENPLNTLYKNVIAVANQLRSSKDAQSPEKTIRSMYLNLIRAVNDLFHLKGTTRGAANIRGLGKRLKGKKGLFRRYLTGKRVDFSARSVISPDPFLSINEVGVPIEVAMVLTVQEVVNEFNKDLILKLLRNGPDKYPGVNTVIFVDRDRNVSTYYPGIVEPAILEKEILKSLETGENHVIVMRHMLDGDVVLFNRQPSLHRLSMLAFRARVLPYRTFRLNLAVCPPFNADFDGDEMNLHQLQLPEARIEAEEIMLAERNIMTPRYGAPIIGGNEDHITASAMISYGGSKVPKHIARHLLAFSGYEGEYPQEDVVPTRKLISLLIPKKIHMRNRSRLCDAVFKHRCPFYQKLGKCPVDVYKTEGKEALIKLVKERMKNAKDKERYEEFLKRIEKEEPKCPFDVYMEIKGGEVISGILDKFAVGAEQAFTIIHHIVRRYGTHEAGKFIDRAFKMALKFLTYHGFTVSAKDFDLPPEAFKIVNEVFKEYDRKIAKLYEDYRTGRLQAEIGSTVEETFRARLRNLLDELRDKAAEALIKFIIDRGRVFENNVLIMTGTKARGDITQFAQMMVTVGAMTVRGQFVSRGYTGRTLPHFKPTKYLEPKALGFVRSSFRLGMDPIEYFFQAAAGRDGLIDTATKTSDSGYLYRKVVHNLEDLVVDYDGSVRTLYGDIVQFLYGEDGIDVAKSDYGKIDVERIIQEVLDDLETGIRIGLLKKKLEVIE